MDALFVAQQKATIALLCEQNSKLVAEVDAATAHMNAAIRDRCRLVAQIAEEQQQKMVELKAKLNEAVAAAQPPPAADLVVLQAERDDLKRRLDLAQAELELLRPIAAERPQLLAQVAEERQQMHAKTKARLDEVAAAMRDLGAVERQRDAIAWELHTARSKER